MQTPLQIEFSGMEARPDIESMVAKRVAELETRFQHITACRVVVKAPGGHHQTGGLYEINIRLVLPDGREVNVGRTPRLDERHSDLAFAIADAFKRARRGLQDQARRLQGQVKQHEHAPTGIVKTVDESGEFGFLEASDGHEVYFHRNSVLDGKFGSLAAGSRVTFVEEMGVKGPQASTVKTLATHRSGN